MTLQVISISSVWSLYPNPVVHFKYFLARIVCIWDGSQNLICFIVTHLLFLFCNSCSCLCPHWRNKIYSFIHITVHRIQCIIYGVVLLFQQAMWRAISAGNMTSYFSRQCDRLFQQVMWRAISAGNVTGYLSRQCDGLFKQAMWRAI